jgi:DNA processing protein
MKTTTPTCASYPDLLRLIPQPPQRLYYDGHLFEKLNDSNALTVAIVGSRRATRYGLDLAFAFAKELSEYGIVIVSGLAEGIDAAAHRGALAGGSGTIAVLGCGLDIFYPYANRALQAQISQEGALVTEFQAGTRPKGDQFPSRNRIISGLSTGVLVVEGAARSGTLITADMALSQGRDVYALPGLANSPNSRTPHKLLRAGATLVETADDILCELELPLRGGVSTQKSPLRRGRRTGSLVSEEKAVLSTVTIVPKTIETIIYETGLQCDKVSSILILLEMRRFISRTIEGEYVAAP